MPMPGKKAIYSPTDRQVGDGAYYDLKEIKGFNEGDEAWRTYLKSDEAVARVAKIMMRSALGYKEIARAILEDLINA